MLAYATRQQDLAVSGTENLTIRSLLDRDQYADPHGEARALGISSAAWPMFGQLWPSGAQLAARMAARPRDSGARILEIGCGLALASLVCHRRGDDITASDCHPLAASFLEHNLALNDLRPLPYRHGHWGTPALLPGEAAPIARDHLTGRFDLIIGSDLLYERDVHGLLAGFIGRHARGRAEVWIVDPDRGNRPAFNRHMALLGFALAEERLDAAAGARSVAYKGRLLVYGRTDTGATHP